MVGRVITMVSRLSLTGYDVVRVLVGVILLTAAGLKGHQLATEPTVGTSLLESRWFLTGVVEFELLFGLWLLAGVWPKPTWAAAISCFGIFACVALHKAFSGHASCGCFGRVHINPWITCSLDLAAVLALLRWRPKLAGQPNGLFGRSDFYRPLAVLATWLAIGIPAALLMVNPRCVKLESAGQNPSYGRIVLLEPEDWVGQRLPLLAQIDIGERLATGQWDVLLYHHDCPHCQELIPHFVRQTSEDNPRPQLALVEMPPYGTVDSGLLPEAAQCARGRLSDSKEWFAETPVVLALSQAVVEEVRPRDRLKALIDDQRLEQRPSSTTSQHLQDMQVVSDAW